MQIETLKVFCDLANLKSFSKAAEANYITQSAVSQQIRGLEKIWKTTFFKRDTRKMVLTHSGELFYKEAELILERYEALKRVLGKTTQELSGDIRLATILGVGLHELPPYIKKMIQSYPHVNVRLKYLRDNQVYEELLKGHADLGIVSFPKNHPRIESIPFRSDELLVVTPANHPLSKHSKIQMTQLQGVPFVAFEKGIPTRKIVDDFFAQNQIRVKIAMEFDNIETLKKAIEVGAGVSILPSIAVKNEIQQKTLKAVQVAGKPLFRPLGILKLKGKTLPLAITKFIEVLLK